MVYLGLGILVVSLSFLVYKARPLSFPDLVTLWRRKEGVEGQTRGEQQTEEGTRPKVSVKEKGLPDSSSGFKDNGFREESDHEDASPQTTPKAIATTTTDSVPLPTFTLSEGDSLAIPTSLSMNSSANITTPSKGPSTNLSLNRIQNQSQPTPMPPPPRPTTTSKRKPQPPTPSQMPPPPTPTPTTNNNNTTNLRPTPTTPSTIRPPPSSASTLRAPTRTLAPSTSTLHPTTRPSKKVLLAPAHSPLDWAHLLTHPPTPSFFRGASLPAHLIRVSPSLLRCHNGRKGRDAWATWQGRVYNLTPYMGFHPGGREELMRGVGGVGRAEGLFLEVHPWVSWEGLLGECLVGVMVGEGEEGGEGEGRLEEVD